MNTGYLFKTRRGEEENRKSSLNLGFHDWLNWTQTLTSLKLEMLVLLAITMSSRLEGVAPRGEVAPVCASLIEHFGGGRGS